MLDVLSLETFQDCISKGWRMRGSIGGQEGETALP